MESDIAKQAMKNVQEAIADEVTAMTGVRPLRVNVNVCGVATPKHPEK